MNTPTPPTPAPGQAAPAGAQSTPLPASASTSASGHALFERPGPSPVPAPPAGALALARLQASRSALAQRLLPPPAPARSGARRAAASAAGAGGGADARGSADWSDWRARLAGTPVGPLLDTGASLLSAWWARQPYRSTVEAVGDELRDTALPVVRRHPWAAVLLSAAVAAGVVWLRPWRSGWLRPHVQPLPKRAGRWLLHQASLLPWQAALPALLAAWRLAQPASPAGAPAAPAGEASAQAGHPVNAQAGMRPPVGSAV